jgi:hypothetical protein
VVTDSGFVAVGADTVGGHDDGFDGSRCAAIWVSGTGTGWTRVDAPGVCEQEEGLYHVTVAPSGTVTAFGKLFDWTSDDPTDPDSWQPTARSDGEISCIPQAWIRDVGVALVWSPDLLCVSDDGGTTWLPTDTSSGPLEGRYVRVNAVVPFGDRFVAVGGDGLEFPGTGAITSGGVGVVWIGTIE